MSQKTILFILALMFFLCIGMWRYAVLWQAEQQLPVDTTEQGLTQNPSVNQREEALYYVTVGNYDAI